MGRLGKGEQKALDRHPGGDGQTDRRTDRQTRQNLYIHAMRAVMSHACLYSLATQHQRPVASTYPPPTEGRRLSWPLCS